MRKHSYWVIQLRESEKASDIMAKASNHGLVGIHKIGVYEDKQIDEIFIQGHFLDYLRFMSDLGKTRK